jgi:hypothetical protein
MRHLLVLNLILGMIWVFFVIVPLEMQDGFSANSAILPKLDDSTSDALSYFTGTGNVQTSAYFLGAYTVSYAPGTLTPAQGDYSYNLPLAYLFVAFQMIILSFVLIVLRLLRAFKDRGLNMGTGEQYVYCHLIFSGWEHCLHEEESVGMKHTAFTLALREQLNEEEEHEKYEATKPNHIAFRRLFSYFFSFSLIGFCMWSLIWAIDKYAVQRGETSTDLTTFIPSIMLTGFNFVLPRIFLVCAEQFEAYETPTEIVSVTTIRSLVLRIIGLLVFFFQNLSQRDSFSCWENYMGQQLYVLYITQIAVNVWVVVFSQAIMKYMRTFKYLKPITPAPEFETAWNLINLLSGQVIIWFGSYFVPLLPFLGVLQFILLFYTLQWATVAFCDRPSKVYKARASLSFISAVSLFLSLLAVTFPLGYAIFRFPSSGSYMPTYTLDENLGNITGAACSSSTFVLSQCYPRTSAEETAYDAIATVCYISPANDDLAPQGYNPTYPNGLQATVGAICAVCPTGCGLFRNKETAYTIFTEEIETWSNASQAILAFITTAPFMATVMFMFLV